MKKQSLDGYGTLRPDVPAGAVPLRGPSGRLYGYLDPKTLTIEFKVQRGGRDQGSTTEAVDLKPYLESVT